MNLTAVKTWASGETLTASDLNSEFSNVYDHTITNSDLDSTGSYVLGELVVGSGISTADGGQLHVHSGSAGTVQAHADADEAVFENSTASGLTILSGNTSAGNIYFGDDGDNDVGKISYSHSTNALTVTTNGTLALTVSSAQLATFAGAATITGLTTATGGITSGSNIVSDTDSTDDLGTTSVRWANVYADSLGDTGQDLGIAATTVNLPSGFIFDYDAADVTITHSANTLTIAGGTLTGTINPDASSVLANGVTATTQSASDNSTKVATTAYADAAAAASAGTPGGSNTHVQFNNSGAFGGSANLTFDGTDLAVGNAAPSSYIDSVHGVIVGDTGDATSEIVLAASTTGVGEINFTDTADTTNQGQISYDHTNNYMSFDTSNTERMRIVSGGNVQVGMAGASGWGNYARLASVETDNAAQINVRGTLENASATGTMFYANCSRAATTAYSFLRCYSSGTSDQEFELRGDGNAYADAAWNGSGADYQEYFESQSGVAAEVGRTVVLDGDKVRYYNAATDSVDDIMGVTRPEADNKNSAVVGNIAWNHWTDKYLTDDYGVYEREDIVVWEWPELLYAEGDTDIPANKNIGDIRRPYACVYERDELFKDPNWTPPEDAVKTFDSVRKLNPSFDPAQEANYQSREERDEWWLIGLLGQIQIKSGEPTNPRWIKMKDISANVELWYVR